MMVAMDQTAQKVIEKYESMLRSGSDPQNWSYSWRSELNKGGFKAVDFLMEKVVRPGKCIGCAACVVVCPVDVFDYVDERPVDSRDEACVFCELCVDVCPILRPPDQDLEHILKFRPPAVDEGFGSYSYAVLCRSTVPEVRAKGQDGGLTSGLLIYALEKGLIKGAVVGDIVEGDHGRPIHRLATSREEILQCSGSRYTYSPNTLALTEAMVKNVGKLAVVGVPCQVDGLRHLQYGGIELSVSKWVRENVVLTIGLFCSEAFTVEGIEALSKELGVAANEIEYINIKGKVVVRFTDGRTTDLSLKEFRRYARPACEFCRDYAAELADIGVGGIGLDGWTFTVIRTEIGHQIFEGALKEGLIEARPIEDAPKSKNLLVKLSTLKRKRDIPALMPSLNEKVEAVRETRLTHVG